ncbi:YvcK family protein [Nordella sp. HKS 07]|uniref:gluconeogenesis factor YvcK family protein n=1 Tax=Nordella sp. HKS 07 TaxID=2712222 RepID=UPI0013E1DA89|nr:gluconeogenesis factor YvcK family protein [Nordella sp. HKS 07]QIG49629.1 YvcK family protein [Nordella sp. HKS 07]
MHEIPQRAEPARPHIVILAGGTASRNLTITLIRQGVRVTRLVPAWDSGGSSKAIREALHILPVGDIRQALMTMAYAEGHAGDVVRVFNARLSEVGNAAALARELAYYAQGAHPVLKTMKPEIAQAILRYLGIFIAAVGPAFDWRRGSVGNFILTGALLAEEGDINAAILAFKSLCSIAGNVWPISQARDLTLVARLKDGRRVEGQHRITALSEADAAVGIAAVSLEMASANPPALAAIGTADAIVYGPGSFYTSVLPHLLVAGVAEAIAGARANKILIGNMLEDRETRAVSLDEMAEGLRQAGAGQSVLTHVLAHEGAVPVERVIGASRFVARAARPMTGPVVIERDFEDPWHRGQHDAGLVASLILQLAAEGVRQL